MNVSRCPSQDEIFEKADLIILTGPLTPERHHIINRDSLNRMKKTAFVFNTARGAMVDEKALCEAIGSGRIAGAGLDVFEQEPIRNAELYKMDQLVVTPHIAFYSEQSLPDMQNKVFDEVIRAVKGEPLRIHV